MEVVNDKKICIIMCSNDSLYFSEAFHYIKGLNVPDGFEIEVLSVEDAVSMASGYNEVMNSTNAKYKIYLHQDVMLVNKNILIELMRIFEDESVGMVGMVGTPNMPSDGVMWHAHRIGGIYSSNVYNSQKVIFGKAKGLYEEVEAVDGLFIATQYDLTWREDLFKGWHYYDASQSFEFRNAGYKVVVPFYETPWVIHDDGLKVLDNQFYCDRLTFLKHYMLKTASSI